MIDKLEHFKTIEFPLDLGKGGSFYFLEIQISLEIDCE